MFLDKCTSPPQFLLINYYALCDNFTQRKLLLYEKARSPHLLTPHKQNKETKRLFTKKLFQIRRYLVGNIELSSFSSMAITVIQCNAMQ